MYKYNGSSSHAITYIDAEFLVATSGPRNSGRIVGGGGAEDDRH